MSRGGDAGTNLSVFTYARAMTGNRALRTIGTVAVVAVGLTACSSGSDDPAAGDGRTAAVYESILHWMIDEEHVVESNERPEWVMFVAPRSEEPIDIDVQVAVVGALDPRIFVRFIDDRTEAVDADSEGEPVRDEGILVGLGAVPQESDRVEVYADRYRNSDDVEAWTVTVRRSGDTWELVGDPAPADVRPLTTGS